MSRHAIRLIIFLMAIFMIASPADARKKKKNQKTAETEYVELEPDKPANEYKALPDSYHRPAKQPKITNNIPFVGNYAHGIDVSHYQGSINWSETAKDPNVGFAYIKATEGTDLVDDMYDYNLREARRCGVKTGSYHFFRPNYSAEAQFRNFTRVVNRKNQDLLPLIDVEVTGGVTIETMHTRLLEFLRLVTNEYGKRPVIYTGRNFYNKYFAGYSAFKAYQFMIAQYTADEPLLNGGDDFIMWQYTSHGRVKGIRGEVDQSRFRGRHSLSEILYR